MQLDQIAKVIQLIVTGLCDALVSELHLYVFGRCFQVMGRLIEFAYTASISVGEKCVIHVMNGAVMYQIDSVVKACCDFLVQQLDPSNAIGIANFAEQISCTELHQKAREYIYMNFSQVSDTQPLSKAVRRELSTTLNHLRHLFTH